ncbi:MAG: cytochrome c-type biogenesis protein [Solirubrobacteraceae bacterium]
MRRRLAVGTTLGLMLAASLIPGAGSALAVQRASFTQIQDDVMCVLCHEPLAVAQSPEAFRERDYIRGLILQGQNRQQIEHNLVEQYGPAVLAKPPAQGFNLFVYIIPPVVLLLGIIMLVITIPRWRRRTREAAAVAPASSHPELSADDARRLDEDLARTT